MSLLPTMYIVGEEYRTPNRNVSKAVNVIPDRFAPSHRKGGQTVYFTVLFENGESLQDSEFRPYEPKDS